MLVSEPLMLANNGKILEYDGGIHIYPICVELQTGVYLTHSFNPPLRRSGGYDEYPALGTITKFGTMLCGSINAYGVCDSIENLLEFAPEIITRTRKFVVTLVKVVRDEEPLKGGWRWHKWGPYIGKHEPTFEYLKDEPLIEFVYCYHIYEQVETVDSITGDRIQL